MPDVLDWLAVARSCFADDTGTLTRGLLTSAFASVIGLERMFHLDQMNDPGFALLTGGRRCPSRHAVSGWRRHLPSMPATIVCPGRRTVAWCPPSGR